ncbi:MAG: polyprenyl synthetase family protein [Myxococcales bacterium FL481]|nr:MAG: polyprenyl synthetase family protein [Myxococcales bacterium FL481]
MTDHPASTNSSASIGDVAETARRDTAPPTAAIAPAVAMVAEDLDAVEIKLAELLQSSIAVIPQVGGHLTFAGGKRLRPMLSLLCARASGYVADHRVTVAAVGELLHTATLLHDDVIDRGEWRRGRPAARLPYGNGMAVLTGDYCLARGLLAVADIGELAAVRSMAETVTRMAEGEIAQLHSAGDWRLEEATYYMVIERKTAALLAWCSSVAGLPAHVAPELFEYGLELGFAFQIADDVLDYAGGEALGKASGQDLREGKATLPLILAAEDDRELRTTLRTLLEGGPPADDELVADIRRRVLASDGLEQALNRARVHADNAASKLAVLAPSRAKTALEALTQYVVERSY